MRHIFQDGAEKRTALSFYTGWLLCSAFFLIDEIVGFKEELAVIWFVLFVLSAVVVCQLIARRARRAAADAFEAGKSQGAIDTWNTVEQLIKEAD